MANKKISDLTAASSLDGSEYVEVAQASASKKAPLSLFALLGVAQTFTASQTFSAGFKVGTSPYASAGEIMLANAVTAKYRKGDNSGDEDFFFCSGNSIGFGALNVSGATYIQNGGVGTVYKSPAHYFQTEAAADVATFTSAQITCKPTAIVCDGHARRKVYSNIASVQTTDATVTTLYSRTATDEAVGRHVAEIDAVKSDGSLTASYVRALRVKRDGGTLTAGTVADNGTDEESGFAACDATIDVSGTTVRDRVTGIAATTIDWTVTHTASETTHA